MIPEYDDHDPSTWYPIGQPYVDPVLLQRLHEIGGLNPFGKPVLELRWGVHHVDPQSTADEPKYLYVVTEELAGFEYREDGHTRFVRKAEDAPPGAVVIAKFGRMKLGERRWFVEQHRSAEFLVRSGRYSHTHDYGEGEISISCRNCGGPMRDTGREDEKECLSCGSHRASIVEYNEVKSERLLNDIPSEGVYDLFMKLETPDGKFRPFDGSALLAVGQEWRRRQKVAARRQSEVASLRLQAADRLRQQRRAVWQAVNLMRKSA